MVLLCCDMSVMNRFIPWVFKTHVTLVRTMLVPLLITTYFVGAYVVATTAVTVVVPPV